MCIIMSLLGYMRSKYKHMSSIIYITSYCPGWNLMSSLVCCVICLFILYTFYPCLGKINSYVPSPTPVKISTFAVDVACGAEFSMVVDINGSVYSFGCPEYGQLGNNSFLTFETTLLYATSLRLFYGRPN